MTITTCRACILLSAMMLAACGPDRVPELSAESGAHPLTGGNGVVAAEVVALDRQDDRLTVRLRLRNTGDDAVDIAPGGDRLANFRAIVGDSRGGTGTRDLSALAEVDHHQVAATALDSLPGHALVELELTWDLQPDLGRDDYPCTLVIGNLYQDDDHLADIIIPIGANAPTVTDDPTPPPAEGAPATAPGTSPGPASVPSSGGVSL